MRISLLCLLALLAPLTALAGDKDAQQALRADLTAYERNVIAPNTADQAAARAALVTLSERREDGALRFVELATGYEAKILPRYQGIVTRLRAATPATRGVQDLNRRLTDAFSKILTAAEQCNAAAKAGNAAEWQAAERAFAAVSFDDALRQYAALQAQALDGPVAVAPASPSPSPSPSPAATPSAAPAPSPAASPSPSASATPPPMQLQQPDADN